MIPKECKRLAEVDFPIAVVSRHCAREKSIRHVHPSTLHLQGRARAIPGSVNIFDFRWKLVDDYTSCRHRLTFSQQTLIDRVAVRRPSSSS
jgi:hypothetical protein